MTRVATNEATFLLCHLMSCVRLYTIELMGSFLLRNCSRNICQRGQTRVVVYPAKSADSCRAAASRAASSAPASSSASKAASMGRGGCASRRAAKPDAAIKTAAPAAAPPMAAPLLPPPSAGGGGSVEGWVVAGGGWIDKLNIGTYVQWAGSRGTCHNRNPAAKHSILRIRTRGGFAISSSGRVGPLLQVGDTPGPSWRPHRTP
eukprot:Gregarina_sp_Poly_1__8997@NODE_547_length_7572_cov_311_443438_g434_i0_p5_GENE_NODE_547_length_7572_cov_311_443438_g434_i0NODE_547_length_7572_cov_311_443438_g434_i0_p5_ORF_typecomplete_len204_score12_36_NODE_547_length_7572_cov_311_443438_g434_i056536264